MLRVAHRLPVHELAARGVDQIFLISPTTTDRRIRRSGELGGGFLYVISRLGVTGVRDTLPDDVSESMLGLLECGRLGRLPRGSSPARESL